MDRLLPDRGPTHRAHAFVLILLICASWIFLTAVITETIVFNTLDIHLDILPQPSIDYNNFTLTPPLWTAITLAAGAYLYQIIWLTYATANIFRRCPTAQQRVYVTAGSPSPAVFRAFIVSCILIIINDILDNRVASACLNFVIIITLHVGLIFSHINHSKYFLSLLLEGLFIDLILVRVLIQNGLATLLTWRILDFYSNLADSITMNYSYRWTLAVMSVHLLIWFITDMTLLKGYVQFTFAPYVVLLVYLSGLLVRYGLGSFDGQFVAGFAIADFLFLAIKATYISWRYRRSCTSTEEDE